LIIQPAVVRLRTRENQRMGTPEQDEAVIRKRAPWVWSALRGAVEKLALEGGEQIKDPDVGECFLWDVAYGPAWMCEAIGWITPELRTQLDEVDRLLDRLSVDRDAWTDEAIMTLPRWEETRHAARGCLPLMPIEPWTAEVWFYQ
jgi:hypothetical protein